MDIRGERETSIRHLLKDYEELIAEQKEFAEYLKKNLGDDWYNICSKSDEKPVKLLFDKWIEIGDRISSFLRTKIKY